MSSCSFGELTHWCISVSGLCQWRICDNQSKAPSSGGAFTIIELLSPLVSKWRSKAGEEDSVPPRSLPELVAKPEDMFCQAVHWRFSHRLHFDHDPVNVNDSIAPALNRFLWLKKEKKKKYQIRLTFHDSLFQNVLYQCIMYEANVWLVAGLQPRFSKAEERVRETLIHKNLLQILF